MRLMCFENVFYDETIAKKCIFEGTILKMYFLRCIFVEGAVLKKYFKKIKKIKIKKMKKKNDFSGKL